MSRIDVLPTEETEADPPAEPAPIGLLRTRLDGTILLANAGLCELLGYPRGALLGRSAADLTHPDDRAAALAQLAALAAGAITGPLHRRYLRADGAAISTRVTSHLDAARDSCVTSFVELLDPPPPPPPRPPDAGLVTYGAAPAPRATSASLEAEVARALRYHDVFVGVLGHDLCNPLSAILGAAELGQRVRDPDATRALFDRITCSGRRMERMIEQLLDLTRIRMAGGLELQRTPSDLAAICRAAIDELRGAREIALDVAGTADGTWDADRLTQLASNLIGNAVEHASGARISIAIDGTDPAAVTLRVHNDGTIPDAIMPVLFEPFRRAPTTRKTAGLGLGLHITQQIALAHGGRVHADSDPQRGTTFTLFLPRAAASIVPPPTDSLGPGSSSSDVRERIVRDISAPRPAAPAASTSEQRLRAVFDASPFGIVVAGPDRVFRMVSRAFAAMVGYVPEELAGRTYAVITHPDDLELNVQLTGQHFADEQSTGYSLEKRYLHRDGSTVWVRVTARPFLDIDTGERLVFGVVEDISSRRQLDQARRDSERMLAAIWDCVVLIGADWRYRFVNGRAAAVLGRAPHELVGADIWGRFPGKPDTLLAEAMREVMAGAHAAPVLLEEYAADRWYESTVSRCDDGILVVWRDVTERKQAELTLRRTLHLRDEFISVTSHELRTPLAALALHLEALDHILGRGADPAQLRTRIEGALRQGERLSDLVEDLLEGSRLAAAPPSLTLSSFDLKDLVREVAERFGPRAARSGCALTLQLDTAAGAWDRARLDRVLASLVGNALKYGPRAPIDITLRAHPDLVELSVRDRGIGITSEDRARIFGRFERAVPSSHYGGLGLGLYIAHQLVEAHGGTISVDSSPGAGAEFVVRLPRRSVTLAGSTS